MGTIFPEELTLDSIKNKDERNVVDLLIRRLSDSWIIIPNFEFRDQGRDHETDVVLIHPLHGIGILEVKGGRITIDKGAWTHNEARIEPQKQAKDNANGLARVLRPVITNPHLKVVWGICLPHVTSIAGRLPHGVGREQLLISPDLEMLEGAVEGLFRHAYSRPDLSSSNMEAVLNELCPNVTFQYDPQTFAERARRQLQTICETQVEALKSLEVHHRVVVIGRAGTGKTYLAIRWAQSGLISDEGERPKRVLLTCYNDPLADRLKKRFAPFMSIDEEDNPSESPSLVVGSFLRTMRDLEGMPKPRFTNTEDNEYWNVRLPAHLIENWATVTERFDRIIVDEAQDFAPAWIGMLESLLDLSGDNQLFLLVDERQQLMPRGFVEPSTDAGWVRGELQKNVRNSHGIARLARKFLDGAEAPSSLPRSEEILGRPAKSETELVEAVTAALDGARDMGLFPKDILVVTSDSYTRDLLRSTLGFVRVEDGRSGRVACETSHRAKGLEAPMVIIAVGAKGIRDNELYVAVTRAINRLDIVAPEELLQRLFRPV
jgi:hypothetical protein